MTIYEQALLNVENGTRFNIDFKNRDLRVGHTYLIKDGQYNGALGISTMSMLETLSEVENLYESFINSMPSERSDNKRRCYFKAPKADEMELEAMIFGEPREVAQYKLEAFILMSILNGCFDEDWNGHWFWQSKKFNDLVLMKEWVM